MAFALLGWNFSINNIVITSMFEPLIAYSLVVTIGLIPLMMANIPVCVYFDLHSKAKLDQIQRQKFLADIWEQQSESFIKKLIIMSVPSAYSERVLLHGTPQGLSWTMLILQTYILNLSRLLSLLKFVLQNCRSSRCQIPYVSSSL